MQLVFLDENTHVFHFLTIFFKLSAISFYYILRCFLFAVKSLQWLTVVIVKFFRMNWVFYIILHLFWKCSTAIIFALIWRTTVTFTVIGVLFCFWMFYCFTYLLLYCSLIFDKCYWVLTWNKFLCNNKTKQNNDIVEVKNCSRTFSWLLIFQLSINNFFLFVKFPLEFCLTNWKSWKKHKI